MSTESLIMIGVLIQLIFVEIRLARLEKSR